VQARFLLGPAGSGKTFRCLDGIRAALRKDPQGPPIIFLAPKQATFQLERQLLTDDALNGFSRLHILSFERLARFIFERLNVAPPAILSGEGRVMVLRALLLRHKDELKLFGQSARRPGFAQQLSHLLGELQQHGATSAKLRDAAGRKGLPAGLVDKLADVGLLQEKYSGWLAENGLQDADCLLAFAAEALKDRFRFSAFRFSDLWLDGFAEMTPLELDLLAAIVPFCENATLAFCLNGAAAADSWLSIWNGVGKTFQQCRQRIEQSPGVAVQIEVLEQDTKKNRFSNKADLAWLEKNWTIAASHPGSRVPDPASIVITACADPEAETSLAAREILKFVRAGNRFRDCAVIVRNLDDYHKPLARAFRRYGIPFFLDRRESIAHHPLAELTRSALRTVAFDWRHEDWFAALKAGFGAVRENDIDRLENAALEFGWQGRKWFSPLPDDVLEPVRKAVFPVFQRLHEGLGGCGFQPDGKRLAELIRQFWADIGVEGVLDDWHAAGKGVSSRQPSPHQSVLEQMESWLDNLALGFAKTVMPLRDWLPVLEAGLGNLTVGVIPPVLDEVLVGAIDRARNPDLKFVLVLGVNETVFPALPASPVILTEAEREALQMFGGSNLREQLSREQFYGYLAFTRASEKLVMTFSRADADGRAMAPSPFIGHLQKLLPSLQTDAAQTGIDLEQVEHVNELVPFIYPHPALTDIAAVTGLSARLSGLRAPDPKENLSPAIAHRLYGPVLKVSVSRLEEFAQCPFRFFVRKGLGARERKKFELDRRERGNFQHELLKKFHEEATADGGRWRDLTPEEARECIGRIAEELAGGFRDGLLQENARSRFAARVMTGAIQDFIAVTVRWLREQNEFDPEKAELDFGTKQSPETAWEIPLAGGRKLSLEGRIDRVDLCRNEQGEALALVLDYKAGGKKLDAVFIEHGIQLQLLAYLNVLSHWKDPEKTFQAKRLVPAGVFYVNLRGELENGGTRNDVLADVAGSKRTAYRHAGRFDADILKKLDRVEAKDQFSYQVNKDGSLRKGSTQALPRPEFERLLRRAEELLRRFGEEIYAGAADLDPYRKGKQTACDYCDYSVACRIDPWTHEFRVLRAGDGETEE